MTNAILHDICSTCTLKDALIARLQSELDERAAIDTEVGFGVLNATETLRQVRRLASGPARRFDAFRSDVKDLKQWNSATGHQPRTDEFYRPAFAVRTGKEDMRIDTTERRSTPVTDDLVLAGKTENGGDGMIHIFEAGFGQAAMQRILEELKGAAVLPYERQRYVLHACQKRFGPILGHARAALYRLGWQMLDHPTLTVVGFADVPSTDLERVYYADKSLFVAKLARRDGVILQGALT